MNWISALEPGSAEEAGTVKVLYNSNLENLCLQGLCKIITFIIIIVVVVVILFAIEHHPYIVVSVH